LSYIYKPGDIFVSTKHGVVTILEIDNQSVYCKYKCRTYDKQKVEERIEFIGEDTFKMWRDYNVYKFYPVKE
jgi:hypothetical protein